MGRTLETREGWSGDATATPRCSDSGASSQCSPSQRTRGGLRSPQTVVCREKDKKGGKVNFHLKVDSGCTYRRGRHEVVNAEH